MLKIQDPDSTLEQLEERTQTSLETISNIIHDVGIEGVDYIGNIPQMINYEHQRLEFGDLRSDMSFTIYRGQRNHEWKLQSTAERDKTTGIQGMILRYGAISRLNHMLLNSEEFKKYTSIVIRGVTKYIRLLPYDLIPLGQHYGLMTPFIDWTLDPEVAMFFACTDGALGDCTPNSEEYASTTGLSSVFTTEYRLSDQDSGRGPYVIGAGILQRPLFQRGLVTMQKPNSYEKNDFIIDPDYCEEIAKKFDYGRKLTDVSNSQEISDMIQRVQNVPSIPKECVRPIARMTSLSVPSLETVIKNMGLTIGTWEEIEPCVPDIQPILQMKKVKLIDDCKTIAERCMNGHTLSVGEAYEFLTMVELERRSRKTIYDHLESGDSLEFLVR